MTRLAVTLLDGPLGTELSARGIETALPLWSAPANLERPEVVSGIHADYADAGARVHVANTFRTQPRWMGAAFEDAARAAVLLARTAIGDRGRLAGSLAPVEDCYLPAQSPGAEAREEHRALARVLRDAGCDLLICETFASAEECWVAVEEAVATGLPTWAALSAGPDADLLTPRRMRDLAAGALARGASRVLVNCTPASRTLPFVEALASLGAPVGAYANAGRADDVIGWQSTEVPSATRYADLAATWVEAGATVVGGCCGTGPIHIRALAERFG